MTDVYTEQAPTHDKEPEHWKYRRPILRAVLVVTLNMVGLVLFGVLSAWALFQLSSAVTVSTFENNATGWSDIFFWGALVGGGLLSFILANAVHSGFLSPPPIWGVNTFLGLWLIIGWLAVWSLYAIPVNHTVQAGEIRYAKDGTIFTQGQTVTGNRREPTSLRLPLSGTAPYLIRIRTSDTDWVTGTVTLSWEVTMTPELEESLRANPPVFTDKYAKNILASRVIDLMRPELERLVRAEAQPGQTAIGEVSGWSRDQASVPMSVRLGLQLENNPSLRPSWLRYLSIQNISIGDWNREERVS